MHHLPHLLQPVEMAQLLNGMDHWCNQHIAPNAQDYDPLLDKPAYVRMSISSAQGASLQGIKPLWPATWSVAAKSSCASRNGYVRCNWCANVPSH